MQFTTAIRHLVEQLSFDFVGRPPEETLWSEAPLLREASEADGMEETELRAGRAPDLEDECRQLLLNLGMESAVELVKVDWNPSLRSTAGYARYPSWQIELNPRLIAFDGQVQRTLRHELAHLVAYHRAGRRRIKPHGPEWRKACADLGIRDEPAHHRLPLPRNRVERGHSYQCPACSVVVKRVRLFKRPTACLKCCNEHAGGSFDSRFKFMKIEAQACSQVVSS